MNKRISPKVVVNQNGIWAVAVRHPHEEIVVAYGLSAAQAEGWIDCINSMGHAVAYYFRAPEMQ